MKKRFLSSLLVLVMVLTLLPAVPIPAAAATNGYTKEQAEKWIRNTIGTSYDIDGAYGVQCVDLIKWYVQTLGHNLGSIGYAYNLNRYPLEQIGLSGWARYSNNVDPQAGDIVVYEANSYQALWTGHCGLIYAIDSSKYYYVDYNGGGRNEGGIARSRALHEFSCIIRPDWPIQNPQTPNNPTVPQPSYPTVEQNLGNDFYAYISYPKGNLNLENRNNNVQTAARNSSDPRQIWHFIRKSTGNNTGRYEIINMYNGLRLDLDNDSLTNGTNIQLYEANNTSAQIWKIVSDADGRSGSYNLLPLDSNYYAMDVSSAETNAGTNVQLWMRNATAAQSFQINKLSDSTVINLLYPTAAQNLGDDFYACISYPSGNLNLENRNNNVQTAARNSSDPRQIWHFIRKSTGYYEVINMYNGLRLNLCNGSLVNGANIQLNEANDTTAQRWKIVGDAYEKIVGDAYGRSGSYNLLPLDSDCFALDVSSAATSAGTNVQLWTRNTESMAQTFQITKVNYSPATEPTTPTTPEIPTIPETPPVYAEKVSLNRTSLTLETGKTFTLTATVSPANAVDQTVVWRSSNTNVAIVSNGTVTGVSKGGATITAECGNVSASCNVIVDGDTPQTQPQGVHFARVTVYFQDQFKDVPTNQWYTDSVAEAFELGLMKGESETMFKPYGDITIAQAVTMAARIHSTYAQDGMVFQQTGKWYQVYLDYAYEKGLIDQAYYNCDVTQKASRAQFAEILANSLPAEALQAINAVADGAIPDVSINASYAGHVYKLYRAGILTGSDANGTFNPTTYITRAEAAAIVSRVAESNNRVSITLE